MQRRMSNTSARHSDKKDERLETDSCPTSPPPESHVNDHVWSGNLTHKNKITFLIRISFSVWITKITLSKQQLIHRCQLSLPDECKRGADNRYAPFPSFS